MSLNSLSKQPAFILKPPPIVPGIHDKNSRPPISLSRANSDNFLSLQALPATIIPFGNNEILEKFLPNLTTIPLKILSLIRVFEPAPKVKIFSFVPNFFKNILNLRTFLV